MLWDFPLHEAFILVGSILVFQPVAAGTGIALCIPPGPVFLIMLPVGPAAFFIFFGICDLFSRKSAWLRDHLAKVIMVADRPAPPKKNRIITFVPFIRVPGAGRYGCVLPAWLFGWVETQGPLPSSLPDGCRPQSLLLQRPPAERSCHVTTAPIRNADTPCTRWNRPSTRNVSPPGSILRRRGHGLARDEKFGSGNGANTKGKYPLNWVFWKKNPFPSEKTGQYSGP